MSGETMKRVVLEKPMCHKLEIVPKACALPGEVLVEVFRCGVCGSDITIYKGKHPWAISPLVMGHEFSGIVVEHGEGVSSPAIGTRVGILPHRVCGKCYGCKLGKSNLCENLRCMGAEADGGHAEYVSVPADMAIPLPDKMPFDDAAMLEPACVAYHGIRRAPHVDGKTVVIIGAGPIGNFAVQAAKVEGAKRVIIGDIDDTRLELARNLGADSTMNLKDKTLKDSLVGIGINTEEIDIFVDCVGLEGQVLNEILACARRNSEIIMIGVLRRENDIPNLAEFVQHEITLYGSTMYTSDDYQKVCEHMSTGRIRIDGMITHRFKLAEIPEVFKFLVSGKEQFFKVMLEIAD